MKNRNYGDRYWSSIKKANGIDPQNVKPLDWDAVFSKLKSLFKRR